MTPEQLKLSAEQARLKLGNNGPRRLGATAADFLGGSTAPAPQPTSAQSAINQAAAALVEEPPKTSPEGPAKVTQVSPTPQADSAPIAPAAAGKVEAKEIPLNARLKIADGHNDEGAFHRMIDLAQRLIAAGLWDGKGELWFHDPYTIHQRVATGAVKLENLQHWQGYEHGEVFETHVALTRETPTPAPVAPTMVAHFPPAPGPRELVINTLLAAPIRIFDSQAVFDKADQLYKARLADLSLEALSKPLFPGKKDGEANRPAANDVERDLAVQKLINSDQQLLNLATSREAALRELQRDRNTFEAAKLAAQLLTKQAA